MNHFLKVLKIFLILLYIFFFSLKSSLLAQTLVFGVLAKRGEDIERHRFYPLEKYLKERLPYSIEFKYLPFEDLKKEALNGRLSFILTNSYQAMVIKELAQKSGYSYKIILSLGQYELGHYYPHFGGVIFTKKDSPFSDLSQLKGQSFGAVNPESLGGYLIALYEFYKLGIKEKDLATKFYGTHDAVVEAVLRGEVAAGTVRTGIIERMVSQGQLKLQDIKILNSKTYPHFPLLISSPLYPEWPILASANLPEDILKDLAKALLAIKEDSSLAQEIEAVFFLPLDYAPLNNLMLELMKGPYEELRGFYFQRFWRNFLPYFIGILLFFIAILSYLTYNLILRNRALSKTKEELERERNFLDTVLKYSDYLILQLDLHGNILWANQKGERICYANFPKNSTINITQCGYLKSIAQIVNFFNEKLYLSQDKLNFVETIELETGERTFEGEMVVIKKKELPESILFFLRDITEKSVMERQKLYLEKLNVLRNVAGGLAHDFNNLLSTVFNKIEILRLKFKDTISTEEFLKIYEEIIECLKQLKVLGRQLLTLVRGEATSKELVDPLELVKEYTKLALAGRSNYSVEFMADEDLAPVEVDKELFSIMWLNLCLNAFEAMPKGGKIIVQIRNTEKNGKPMVKFSIEDFGVGIPEKHLSQIFEPFFTTKPGGSGLGLYVAKEVVEAHAGEISIQSQVGKGTKVEILIPASTSFITEDRKVKFTKPIVSKRILLMDDDDLLRDSLKELLEILGYQVETATDGEMAYRIFQEALSSGKPFDIVILDLIVPGKWTGLDTYQEIKKLDPQVKTIVMSGYFSEPVLKEYSKYNFYGALTKPFSIQDLLKLLEN